jgi:hypothetical protein
VDELELLSLLVLKVECLVEGSGQVALLMFEEGSNGAEQQVARDGCDGVQVDHQALVESILPANLQSWASQMGCISPGLTRSG